MAFISGLVGWKVMMGLVRISVIAPLRFIILWLGHWVVRSVWF